MALALLVPFQGPKKSRFSGPTLSNAPRNDVAPLKTITYCAIKTTGTLIVGITAWVISDKYNGLGSSAGIYSMYYCKYTNPNERIKGVNYIDSAYVRE
jgi:hypothetical protein